MQIKILVFGRVEHTHDSKKFQKISFMVIHLNVLHATTSYFCPWSKVVVTSYLSFQQRNLWFFILIVFAIKNQNAVLIDLSWPTASQFLGPLIMIFNKSLNLHSLWRTPYYGWSYIIPISFFAKSFGLQKLL